MKGARFCSFFFYGLSLVFFFFKYLRILDGKPVKMLVKGRDGARVTFKIELRQVLRSTLCIRSKDFA